MRARILMPVGPAIHFYSPVSQDAIAVSWNVWRFHYSLGSSNDCLQGMTVMGNGLKHFWTMTVCPPQDLHRHVHIDARLTRTNPLPGGPCRLTRNRTVPPLVPRKQKNVRASLGLAAIKQIRLDLARWHASAYPRQLDGAPSPAVRV